MLPSVEAKKKKKLRVLLLLPSPFSVPFSTMEKRKERDDEAGGAENIPLYVAFPFAFY